MNATNRYFTLLLLPLLLLLALPEPEARAQDDEPGYEVTITATDQSGNSQDLVIGMRPDATDEQDPLDDPAPPPPPGGFYAAIAGTEANTAEGEETNYYTDLRAITDDTLEFELTYTPEGEGPIELTFDPEVLEEIGYFQAVDLASEGQLFSQDLTETSSIEASPSALEDGLLIRAAADSPTAAEGLVINEFLADPAGTTDANNDGTVDSSDDEFVELFNGTSGTIDLSGYQLTNASDDSYTFPDGTTLEAEQGGVVFGGGSPTGIPAAFTGTGLPALGDGGDMIYLISAAGDTVNTVSYADGEAAGTSLARNPNGTGFFEPQDTFGPMTATTVGRNNETGEVIPVELAGALQATVEGRTVILHWQTLSERNNSHFTVQSCPSDSKGSSPDDDCEWRTVARVESKAPEGTSAEPLSYGAEVTELQPGLYSLRLAHHSLDGDVAFNSSTREVNVGLGEATFSLGAPSPSLLRPGQATRLRFRVPEAETGSVEAALYNSLGQRVRSFDVPEGVRRGQIYVEAGSLASGRYFVHLVAGSQATTRTIMVVR